MTKRHRHCHKVVITFAVLLCSFELVLIIYTLASRSSLSQPEDDPTETITKMKCSKDQQAVECSDVLVNGVKGEWVQGTHSNQSDLGILKDEDIREKLNLPSELHRNDLR